MGTENAHSLASFPSGVVPLRDVAVHLHPRDNVAIAKADLQADTALAQEESVSPLVLRQPIPSGHNRPFTQLRGQVVSDLYKLALSDGQQRYLLYVADPEMATHWERQVATLIQATHAQPVRLTNEWLTKQAKTLRNTVRSGLGFLPEAVEPSVWVEGRWTGSGPAI